MPRIRSIKPEFFIDEELAELHPLDRLLFIGLWTQADREGRLADRPKRLKAALLPYDARDVDKALQRLHDAGFIERYETAGQRFIQVRNFDKHQYPNSKESASTIPAPCSNGTSTPLIGKGMDNRKGAGEDAREATPLSGCVDLITETYGTFPTVKQREKLSLLCERYPNAADRLAFGIAKAKAAGKQNAGFAIGCAESASVQEMERVDDDFWVGERV